MIDSLYLQSRIGRRLVLLFVACALVPLGLAITYSLHELQSALDRQQDQELLLTARSYGTSVLGRLEGAQAVLDSLTTAAEGDETWLRDRVARSTWARRVGMIDARHGASPPGFPSIEWPRPLNVGAGHAALVWRLNEGEEPQFYFVQQAGPGRWILVELSPDWLWEKAEEFSAGDALAIVTASGEVLLATSGLDPGARTIVARSVSSPDGRTDSRRSAASEADEGRWRVRTWEIFLESVYAAPSWHVVAVRENRTLLSQLGELRVLFPGIFALTIVLVALLSVGQIRRTVDPLGRLIEGTRRLARRDFGSRVTVQGDDEFAELARSFNRMADDLGAQFSAMETLSEVDRLLLRSPGLEQILDSVLPRIAGILGCRTLSVMLLDPDAAEHARMYDYRSDQPAAQPVRRVTVDRASLLRACESSSGDRIAAAQMDDGSFLSPLVQAGARTFELWPLRHDGEFAGVLCLGFDEALRDPAAPVIQCGDFADRLSIVLSNLARTERLFRQANFDSLTALPNRQVLRDRLTQELHEAESGDRTGAVLYIDLDHFKHVNDTAGHTTGDELLRIIARRLESCVTRDATVARLGGDEFAVLLPSVPDIEAVQSVADRVLAVTSQTIVIDGREHHVAASIGITAFPLDGRTVEELLKNGDIAMYRAKESGRGRAVFFEPQMQEEMRQRAAIESGLFRAFQQEAFEVVYQPIVECGSQRTRGVEALLRWPDKDGQAAGAPAMFIPVAEQCGLIVGLGEWVLKTACSHYRAWRSEGIELDYIAVNASVRQLKEPDFVARVLEILSDHDVPAHALQIEITESALAEGSVLENTLQELAARGIRLALDDFGTGYSSLSYLRTYPIHTVKIDKSFVGDVPRSPASARLVESIIMMSRALHKHVVAEGVESERQRRFLEEQGCGSMQGFLFGRPMNAAELIEHLAWRPAATGTHRVGPFRPG